MKKVTISDSKYVSKVGTIIETQQMTEMEKYFKIELAGGEDLNHDPGQFVMVSVPGIGEAPISISSSPTARGYFELVIRNAGKVTSKFHQLNTGDKIGVRGPFGTGFPVNKFRGNDLLFVCGGLGVVPLRSLINYVIDNRRDYGKVTILLGCKEPKQLLYKGELEEWEKRADIQFNCTVDRGDEDWKGNVGLITTLIPGVNLDVHQTYSVVCGPPIMYKFVVQELKKKEIPDRHIYLSLERHMKCGVGKCGHCQINNYYCCQEGPVFSLEQIKDTQEAL